MSPDRPVIGILFMLGFCLVAPMSDSIAKLLGGIVPLIVLLLVRFGFQVLILGPVAVARGERILWPAPIMWLVVLRSVLHVGGIASMFTALRFLPLADSIAIAFVMPFILLLLGHFLMKEEVGVRRIGACLVGFLGTLLVMQPSFAKVGAPALLPVAVAFMFAGFMLVTRQIARVTDPIALQATSGALSIALLLPILLFLPDAAREWDFGALGLDHFVLLVGLGILGTSGHLLMTWSLRFAPASTVAPMQYLEIPVAALLGLVIFGDFPNGIALIGIAITIGAGLYVILRESAISRHTAPPPPPAAPPAA